MEPWRRKQTLFNLGILAVLLVIVYVAVPALLHQMGLWASQYDPNAAEAGVEYQEAAEISLIRGPVPEVTLEPTDADPIVVNAANRDQLRQLADRFGIQGEDRENAKRLYEQYLAAPKDGEARARLLPDKDSSRKVRVEFLRD